MEIVKKGSFFKLVLRPFAVRKSKMALDDVHSVLLNRVLVRLYEDVATINAQIHQVHAGKLT